MGNRREYITTNSSQTKRLAEKFLKEIIPQAPENKALVLALKGELGGGKTTFLQGLEKALRIRNKIRSPTFVILRSFNIRLAGFEKFYHLDCYRIQRKKEILALGWKNLLSDSKNIIAVEWAEKIEKILPSKRVTISFKWLDKNKRKIIIKNLLSK